MSAPSNKAAEAEDREALLAEIRRAWNDRDAWKRLALSLPSDKAELLREARWALDRVEGRHEHATSLFHDATRWFSEDAPFGPATNLYDWVFEPVRTTLAKLDSLRPTLSNKVVDTQELLPCPSGHTKTRRDNNNIYGSWWVKCAEGECSWRAAGDTEAEAIRAWNTRSTQCSGDTQDALEALADLTDAFLSRHGCFPVDQTNDKERHWHRAMKRAYGIVGQPNTLNREIALSGTTHSPSEAEVVCKCMDHAELDERPGLGKPRYHGDADNADAKEYFQLWQGAIRRANRWRGIAAAMGYEPEAHSDVKPREQWLLDRIEKFRREAALSLPVELLREARKGFASICADRNFTSAKCRAEYEIRRIDSHLGEMK